MKKKAKVSSAIIDNRRARFDYELAEDYTVGIALTGPEVKAARNNRVSNTSPVVGSAANSTIRSATSNTNARFNAHNAAND